MLPTFYYPEDLRDGPFLPNLKWAHPPARVVRALKVICIVFPILLFFSCFILVLAQLSQLGSKTQIRLRQGETMLDYVQKHNLCKDVGSISQNTTNITDPMILTACENLTSLTKEYYKKKDKVVMPFDHEFLISGTKICDKKTQVMLIIHAYHDFLDRRQAIRETWGGAAVTKSWPNRTITHNIKIAFIFGKHRNHTADKRLQNESDRYGDVIQGDFQDSYTNMTLKSLLGLKWVSKYCPNAKYFIKSDDDMIINFPYLLEILDKTNMSWSIMGPLNEGANVYRKTSKWAIPEKLYPFAFYPPYESGSTYIIGSDLVKPLFDTAKYVPRIFIDDVYITGILGKLLNVRHHRQKGFAYWVNKAPPVCNILLDNIVTGTRMKPSLLYSIWEQIKTAKQEQCLPKQ